MIAEPREIRDPGILDAGAFELQRPHGFPEERRLARLRFDHCQLELWTDEFQGDGGRSAARSEVEPPARRGWRKSRRGRRFQKQTVGGFIAQRIERQRCQVDSLVPARQQAVIRLERAENRGGESDVGQVCASKERFSKLPRSHGR